MPFSPNSALYEKNYPRNIKYMPVVIFFASLDFGKNCYSRTASWSIISIHGERPAVDKEQGRNKESMKNRE